MRSARERLAGVPRVAAMGAADRASTRWPLTASVAINYSSFGGSIAPGFRSALSGEANLMLEGFFFEPSRRREVIVCVTRARVLGRVAPQNICCAPGLGGPGRSPSGSALRRGPCSMGSAVPSNAGKGACASPDTTLLRANTGRGAQAAGCGAPAQSGDGDGVVKGAADLPALPASSASSAASCTSGKVGGCRCCARSRRSHDGAAGGAMGKGSNGADCGCGAAGGDGAANATAGEATGANGANGAAGATGGAAGGGAAGRAVGRVVGDVDGATAALAEVSCNVTGPPGTHSALQAQVSHAAGEGDGSLVPLPP